MAAWTVRPAVKLTSPSNEEHNPKVRRTMAITQTAVRPPGRRPRPAWASNCVEASGVTNVDMIACLCQIKAAGRLERPAAATPARFHIHQIGSGLHPLLGMVRTGRLGLGLGIESIGRSLSIIPNLPPSFWPMPLKVSGLMAAFWTATHGGGISCHARKTSRLCCRPGRLLLVGGRRGMPVSPHGPRFHHLRQPLVVGIRPWMHDDRR